MRARRRTVLRAILLLVFGLCVWNAAQARAATAESATAPLAAHGSTILVAFPISKCHTDFNGVGAP